MSGFFLIFFVVTNLIIRNTMIEAGKMAHSVKALATKPDYLTLASRTHITERTDHHMHVIPHVSMSSLFDTHIQGK